MYQAELSEIQMNMDEIIVREVVEFVEKNTPNKKTFIGLNKVGLGLSEETKCKIKEHGIKLKKLIERYDALFELSMDDNALPIIRLRDPQGNGTSFQTNTAFRSNSGGNLENLFDFAFIPQDVERQLTELALKEDWGKKEEGKESALNEVYSIYLSEGFKRKPSVAKKQLCLLRYRAC